MQFDVHELGEELVVDCQSDLLSYLSTRLVVPFRPLPSAPPVVPTLNPVFEFGGEAHSLVTQHAAALPKRELGKCCGSLAADQYRILNALDMLISGY